MNEVAYVVKAKFPIFALSFSRHFAKDQLGLGNISGATGRELRDETIGKLEKTSIYKKRDSHLTIIKEKTFKKIFLYFWSVRASAKSHFPFSHSFVPFVLFPPVSCPNSVPERPKQWLFRPFAIHAIYSLVNSARADFLLSKGDKTVCFGPTKCDILGLVCPDGKSTKFFSMNCEIREDKSTTPNKSPKG